ncbi:response regulator [Devosia honganensis]|uniref:Response regulator n=1 Tax=Devosia honganensis TaxID=1610527 RepID=A0ABV7WYM5_9HYPH
MKGWPPAGQKRFRILCVEDEAQLRRDIADELAEAGYDVIEAGNGEEALAILAKNRPDLVLCDISMPGLSGYEVLSALRETGSDSAETPFVFLSALADPRQIVDGKRLGADDYLVKPIDYDLLLATVDARLRQIERIRAARRQGRPADAATSSASFGLTPAETRIASALAQGRTPAQIAAGFNISRTTVTFHLRNIFQKTGTSRQAELVAVLLGAEGMR